MRIVVYGLGKRFNDQRRMLEQLFDIVGYSDSKVCSWLSNYIEPKNLNNIEYDAIYITSIKNFEEIKKELVSRYGVLEEKILTLRSLSGIIDGSEERIEWVKRQLREIPKGKILLDAGAGELRFKSYCKHLKYIAQDFGKYDPQKEPGGIKGGDTWDTSGVDIISDIVDIPLEDSSIDVILCSEVIEHIINPMKAIKEFSRLLKPGGMLILTAPVCSLTHMAPYYYYNGFSKYWYSQVLEDYDFDVRSCEANGNLFMYFAWWLFRLDAMARYYSKYNMTEAELGVIKQSISILMKIEENDINSNESLCFGYNIIASKKENC